MPNHNQRNAVVAIGSGRKINHKGTEDALIRKGLADRCLLGKIRLSDQGVALLRQLIPNYFERTGT